MGWSLPPLTFPDAVAAHPLAFASLATALVALGWWWHLTHQPYRPVLDRAAQERALIARRSYRVRAEAERRAEQMLREVLGEPVFEQFVRRGYLEVRSPTFPTRVYLVPEHQGPVTVCEYGKPVMRLCVQCIERVPDYDAVAMHKLMIEGAEHDYLRVANRV
jgi:hypothetical protein